MEDKKNTLEWENICLEAKLPNNKSLPILHNCHGRAESGKVLIMLGPSGSGKTSLLKVLTAKITNNYKTNGKIFFNGKELQPQFLDKIALLEQESNFLSYYTVFNFLKFNLNCQNNKSCNILEIENILKRFKIYKLRNTKLANLSGGEKKRVLLANEILTKKEVLILDEPTTGLDSHLSISLFSLLQELARKDNLMIITTVHQPSLVMLNFTDDLIFLFQGKTIYSGEYKLATEYFSKHKLNSPNYLTFPEFLFELASEDTPFTEISEQIPNYYKLIPQNSLPIKNSNSSKKTSRFTFRIFSIINLLQRQYAMFTNGVVGKRFLFTFLVILFFCYAVLFLSSLALQSFDDEIWFKIYKSFIDEKLLDKLLKYHLVKNGFSGIAFLYFTATTSFLSMSLSEYQYNLTEISKKIYSYFEFFICVVIVQFFLNYLFLAIISIFFILQSLETFKLFLRYFILLPPFLILQSLLFYSAFNSEFGVFLMNNVVFFFPQLIFSVGENAFKPVFLLFCTLEFIISFMPFLFYKKMAAFKFEKELQPICDISKPPSKEFNESFLYAQRIFFESPKHHISSLKDWNADRVFGVGCLTLFMFTWLIFLFFRKNYGIWNRILLERK